jgi:hypothetical protein
MTSVEPCKGCRAGRYGAADAPSHDSTQCLACPSGYSTYDGAYAAGGEPTAASYAAFGGYSYAGKGQTSCLPCARGRGPVDSAYGTGVECGSCALGYIATIVGEGYVCEACPAGLFDPKASVASKGTASESKFNLPCEACPAGYFNAAAASPSCSGCAPGKFTENSESNTACSGSSCPVGYVGPIACFRGASYRTREEGGAGMNQGCDDVTSLCKSCPSGYEAHDGSVYGQCGTMLCEGNAECRGMGLETIDDCEEHCGGITNNVGCSSSSSGHCSLNKCSCSSKTHLTCNEKGQNYKCRPLPTPAPTPAPTNNLPCTGVASESWFGNVTDTDSDHECIWPAEAVITANLEARTVTFALKLYENDVS